MVKKRSETKRRRRFQIRLCVSVESLLRIALRLEQRQLDHQLPLRPSVTRLSLQLLATGTPLDDLELEDEPAWDHQEEPKDTPDATAGE